MNQSLFKRGPKAPETSVADASTAYTEGSVQFVDVREPDEWAEGHIPGAVHIPLGSLPGRAGELDAERPVVVVCRSGVRSLAGTEILLDAGFSDAKSMAGGMIDWTEAGNPVER